MIPAQIIEEIRNKAEIVKVISEYVQLRKRGKNYLGLCPFHPEKDASFTVSQEKQIFHCFGCNEGGNVFDFIMKIENIGFAEAVEELGGKLGISVPKPSSSSASRTEKEKLYQIMLSAAKYFQASLENKEGEAAREYLSKRGITEQTRKLFRLGYSPAGWDNLFSHLVSRGFEPQMMEKSSLTLPREGKNGYYDRFRNRLIFPILEQRDRVIAFGGRALGNEEPKYLNSSDSAVYHKGETLFGLNLSKESIKKSRSALLVEGYFDLITPFQAGITNIVASLGTALTVTQCKLFSRYCDTVILGFDADAAGGVAADRSIELFRGQGMRVKIALLTGGKDPDEIIRSHGAGAFKQCIGSALPYLEYKISRVLSRHNLKEIEARGAALRETARVLQEEKDPFVQKEYAKLFAPSLLTDTDTLLTEAKRQQHYRLNLKNAQRGITAKPGSKLAEAEKTLIALAAQDRGLLARLKEDLRQEDFSLPETRAVAELLYTAVFEEENPSHFLLQNLPDEGAKKFLSKALLGEQLGTEGKAEEIVNDCLKVIKSEQQKGRIAALRLELQEAEKAGNAEKATELISALKSEIG